MQHHQHKSNVRERVNDIDTWCPLRAPRHANSKSAETSSFVLQVAADSLTFCAATFTRSHCAPQWHKRHRPLCHIGAIRVPKSPVSFRRHLCPNTSCVIPKKLVSQSLLFHSEDTCVLIPHVSFRSNPCPKVSCFIPKTLVS